MRFGLILAASFAALLAMPSRADAQTQVDVELVLAVDISYSMDFDELALQREGYITALRSKEFIDALRGSAYGMMQSASTAAIGAKTGTSCPSACRATSQATAAATAHWATCHRLARKRATRAR